MAEMQENQVIELKASAAGQDRAKLSDAADDGTGVTSSEVSKKDVIKQQAGEEAKTGSSSADALSAERKSSALQDDAGGSEVRVGGNFAIRLTDSSPKEITFDIVGPATDEEIQLRSDIESSITTLKGILFGFAGKSRV